MAEWQFTFPTSRTCLWDETPTAQSLDLHLTGNSWLCVQFSFSALQLAVRHAKQKTNKTLDCFLIATAWITEAEGVALEVDRFDPGRLDVKGQRLVPTTLIPGDIPIPCQVVVGCLPQSSYLTHNLTNIHDAFKELKHHLSLYPPSLDPALLLSLRIHCTCSKDGVLTIQCGCIIPALICEATPIRDIAIVKTALARNLSGPLPLSTLQGRIKHGYITMESTRKLVLLLHSDPKASSLPLIGIWISGVGSVYHPLVWLACVTYVYSGGLCDRVWGEGEGERFVTLVYCEGSTQPTYWQCTLKSSGGGSVESVPFEIASGETLMQPAADHDSVCFELHPALESTALHTLLESAMKTSGIDPPPSCDSPYVHSKDMSCDMPLPLPHPTPTQAPSGPNRDSELSMLSCLSLTDGGPQQQQPQSLSALGGSTATLGSSITPPHHTTPSTRSAPQTKNNKENVPPKRRSENNNSGVVFSPIQSNRNSAEQTMTTPQNAVYTGTQPGSSSSSLTQTQGTTTHPTLNRQEASRQEELEQQLRALQEQVKCLLQTQSAEAPVSETTPLATPTNEVSTNTGDSLYWPHQPPPFALSPQHTQSSLCDENSSMCSSMIAGLSVDTATSMLSRNTSEMHLDLQSFAQSPSPPHSPSFEESASTVGGRLDNGVEGEREDNGSPVSLLFKDQQQFYKNMLAQVNDLLHTQSREESPSISSRSCSHSSTLNNSPEHSITPAATPTHNTTPTDNVDQSSPADEHSAEMDLQQSTASYITGHSYVMEHSLPSGTRLSSQSNTSSRILPQPKSFDVDTRLPTLTTHQDQGRPSSPVALSSSLNIHPDVLQQYYATDISMLPVPRIMYSRGFDGGGVGESVLLPGNHLGSTDCTLDEHTQLADMIALKYLKDKGNYSGGRILQSDMLAIGGEGFNKEALTGLSTTFDGGANMSMATRQYLQRHHLMPGTSGGVKEEGSSVTSVCSDSESESEKILDIQRLRTLPKLI